jgi:Arc/MetJ-type ribon-helix-helix transcriptional regulator
VTYSDIAEQLSQYVKAFSEKIAFCTKWLDLFKTPEMQARLSDIYTQYFDFFIKVATWYLKPKASKILDSFNSKFATRYKSASEAIKESIQMIDDQARFETVRETKQIRPQFDRAIAHLEQLSLATLDSVRKGMRGKEDDFEAARTMCTLLEQMDERNRQLEERSIQMQERSKKSPFLLRKYFQASLTVLERI